MSDFKRLKELLDEGFVPTGKNREVDTEDGLLLTVGLKRDNENLAKDVRGKENVASAKILLNTYHSEK